MEETAPEQPGNIFPADSSHVRRQRNRAEYNLRSAYRSQGRYQDRIPEQHDSHKQAGSDFPEAVGLLSFRHTAWPDEQLYAAQLLAQQPRRVYSAHGLDRIGKV